MARLRRLAAAAVLLAGAGCGDELTSRALQDGDIIQTRFGAASVVLLAEKTKVGPVYQLEFHTCSSNMLTPEFDPDRDADVPAPPGLQRRWLWTCRR
ncbi:MAG: hypothetical protein ACKVWR_03590 [Acidimicrobiales bacterium]